MADIKLKNKSGEDVIYNGVNSVVLKGIDGNDQEFTQGGSSDDFDFKGMYLKTISKAIDNKGYFQGLDDYQFENCASLAIASFSACTNIGQGAFSKCSTLTSVNFPACTSIGRNAFQYCDSLTLVSFPACTNIDTEAFENCTSLTSIFLPVCATIWSNAFYGCTALTTANIPFAVEIDFRDCSALTNVILKGFGLNTWSPFEGCTNLQSIYVQSECLSKFASGALSDYSDKLVPIDNDGLAVYPYEYYESTITAVPESKTNASIIGNNAFYSCSSLTSASFPACTSIGRNAFQYCDSLTLVSFPACTNIGGNVFYNCPLQEVEFPLCTNIGDYAFENCTSLTTASFPACTNIGELVFSNCTSLESLYIGTSISKVCEFTGWDFLFGDNIPTIYVPVELLSDYKIANGWSQYANYIVPNVHKTNVESLSITADDVYGQDTHTTIHYIALWNSEEGAQFEETKDVQSEEFSKNTGDAPIQRTISFTYEGKTATTTITQDIIKELDLITYIDGSKDVIEPPQKERVSSHEFYWNENLATVSFPICTRISDNAFGNCISLTLASFPVCTSISDNAFTNCSSLATLYIGTSISTVCTLGNDAFQGCDVLTSIYVPASLVDSYKAASNWSSVSSKIVAYNG